MKPRIHTRQLALGRPAQGQASVGNRTRSALLLTCFPLSCCQWGIRTPWSQKACRGLLHPLEALPRKHFCWRAFMSRWGGPLSSQEERRDIETGFGEAGSSALFPILCVLGNKWVPRTCARWQVLVTWDPTRTAAGVSI